MEFFPTPPKSDQEVNPTMIEEQNTPQQQSLSRIIEDVLGGHVLEGSELVVVSFEVGEEVITIMEAADEVPQDSGLEGGSNLRGDRGIE